jgi:hypothetical protein
LAPRFAPVLIIASILKFLFIDLWLRVLLCSLIRSLLRRGIPRWVQQAHLFQASQFLLDLVALACLVEDALGSSPTGHIRMRIQSAYVL